MLGTQNASAARPANPAESAALTELVAELIGECAEDSSAQVSFYDGSFSTVDPRWAVLLPNATGLDCGMHTGYVFVLEGAWTLYDTFNEFTWCNHLGLPQSVIGELSIDCRPKPAGVTIGIEGLWVTGRGWGSIRPRVLSTGGVPSGTISGIRWRRWGRGTAYGRGYTSIYRPGGGYYRRLGRIRLRATHKRSCGPGGQSVYSSLRISPVKRPGGRYARWFYFAGIRNLCE